MSRNRGNDRRATYEKNRSVSATSERSGYISGNVVRKLAPVNPLEEAPERRQAPSVRKNREKARHMSFGYVLFLVAAMCTAAFVLLNYIQLQAELTQKTKDVATKEIKLNNLKSANDEAYSRIVGSIDLEEIKRIAIGELGMTYAQEGQIVLYANEQNDYMRQATETNR